MPRPMALCALFCETWDGASWPYTRARLYGMDKVRNRMVRICEFAVVFPFTLPIHPPRFRTLGMELWMEARKAGLPLLHWGLTDTNPALH